MRNSGPLSSCAGGTSGDCSFRLVSTSARNVRAGCGVMTCVAFALPTVSTSAQDSAAFAVCEQQLCQLAAKG